MSQPSSPARSVRFSTGERTVHWTLGIALLILIATGALLFFPFLGSLIGNRQAVRTVHEWAGWFVPIPLALALFSRAFRADARRLNRFQPGDWEWLRSRGQSGSFTGKFNPGQKLYAAFALGSVLVMFGTGVMMFFSSAFADSLRTGATFVHDWLAIAFGVAVLGHIVMAFRDTEALAGMVTGAPVEEPVP